MPKATLINGAGQRVVVESDTPEAQNYFGQGYKLETKPVLPDTTPPAEKKPTIAQVAGNINIPDYTPDEAYKTIGDQYKSVATAPVDEAAIRTQTRDRLQSQIDAINQVYNQKLSEAKIVGEGRLGTGRATQARSGLLGSDFAAGQNDKITNLNTSEQDVIQADRLAKVTSVLNQAETDAKTEIADKKKAIAEGSTKYLEFLGTQDKRKNEKLTALATSLLAQGVDPTQLSADQIAKITSSYGTDAGTFQSIYNTAKLAKDKADAELLKTKTEQQKLVADTKKAEADAAKAAVDPNAFFELGEGQARYVYDPVTKTAKVVAERAKTYKPGTGSGGGGGYGVGSNGTYSNDLDALINQVGAGISVKNQRDAYYSALKSARNDEDKISTVAKVLNITGAPKADLVNTALGQKSLSQAISLLEKGTKTGLVQAGKDYAFNLVGDQVSPELTQLKQLITAALQPYRSSVTGAAWGQQEEAEYRSMFGNIKDKPEVLLTKLKGLESILKNKRVGIVQAYADPLGSSSAFNSYYSDVPVTTTPTTPVVTGATVKVKNPNTGQIGTIPAANLQKALSKGYIQVN